MARKKVMDLDTDAMVQFEKVGQTFEGYLIGSKKITTDYGPSLVHVFQNDEGNVGIYGSKQLDDKISRIAPGTMTYITFGGKVKIPGGKTMKKFNVEYDDEDSIPVDEVKINFQQSEEPEQDDEPAPKKRAKAAREEPEQDEEPEQEELEAAAEEDDEEGEGEAAPVAKTKAPYQAPKPKADAKPLGASKGNADRVNELLNKRRAPTA